MLVQTGNPGLAMDLKISMEFAKWVVFPNTFLYHSESGNPKTEAEDLIVAHTRVRRITCRRKHAIARQCTLEVHVPRTIGAIEI